MTVTKGRPTLCKLGCLVPVLLQRLPPGPVDIIGDVHGEFEALVALLRHLGCDPDRCTVERPLVFVGDLIDRGPNSPAVVELVMRLVEAGVATCIIGNHELNLLLRLEKEGNGWARHDDLDAFQVEEGDQFRHIPFGSHRASDDQVERFLAFFRTLPLALVRDDLRVVHACWDGPSMERLSGDHDLVTLARRWGRQIRDILDERGVRAREREEKSTFAQLRRLDVRPTRNCVAHAEAAEARQSRHPIKVLTSGREERIPFEDIFFTGGKWRFVRRASWWSSYAEEPPVVVGHYWRRRADAQIVGKPDSWQTDRYTDWTGPRGNVFCVDFSVGRRFLERHSGTTSGFEGALAALRWPERQLVFDDGVELPTTGWGGG